MTAQLCPPSTPGAGVGHVYLDYVCHLCSRTNQFPNHYKIAFSLYMPGLCECL